MDFRFGRGVSPSRFGCRRARELSDPVLTVASGRFGGHSKKTVVLITGNACAASSTDIVPTLLVLHQPE
jgi:hypothetical protein